MEFQLGKQQTFPFQHIMHCIEALRIEIICRADDTPRYTTSDRQPVSGIGQERQCRDWDKLERWAQENTACYKYLNYTLNAEPDQRVRYVFCQPEAPYAVKIEEYLKYREGM